MTALARSGKGAVHRRPRFPRRARQGALLGFLLILLTLAGTAAFAFWATSGQGVASASTGTLSPPVNLVGSTPSGSSTVNLSWTASTGSTVPQGYYVIRTRVSDGTAAAACGSSPSALVSSTSCVDSLVPDGTYAYSGTAVFNSWTSVGAPSSSVTVLADVTPPVVTVTKVNGTARTFPYSTKPAVTTIGGACGTASGDLSTVRPLLDGAATTPATASCVSGAWSLTLSTALSAEATYALSATQTDVAGNTGTAAAKAVVIDNTAPTVTGVSSTLANGSYRVSKVVPVTVTFSEPVTVTGSPKLSLATGTPAATLVSYSSGSGTSTLTFSYTVAAGNTSAGLDYSSATALTLGTGTIRDAATNNAALTLAAPGASGSLGLATDLVIDTTAPTVTGVSSTLADGSYKAAKAVPVTVTFSEPVTVTGTPQLSLATGSPVATKISYTSGSGTTTLTFTYTVAAGNTSADLDYSSTAALTGTIKDAALNPATLTLVPPGTGGSLGVANNLVIDTTAPTVTGVSSTLADGTYPSGQVVPVTVTFSEPVTVTGTPQLSLATGSPAATLVSYTSGSGTSTLTFTYIVAPGNSSADLNYSSTTALTLNGGTIRDVATNNATLTLAALGANGSLGVGTNLVIDTIAPTVTGVSSTLADGTYPSGQDVPVTVAFSAPVTVTGTPQLSLATGSPAATLASYTSGSGTSTLTFAYTVATGNTAADLDYSDTTALALNGGTIRGATNHNAILTLAAPGDSGSLGVASNIVIDAIAPNVVAVTLANGGRSGTADTGDTVTITFSKALGAATVCQSWTTSSGSLSGNSGGVTVTITDNGLNDVLTVTADGCSGGSGLNVGSIALGADYVSMTTTFDGRGSNASAVGLSSDGVLTITLGRGSGGLDTGGTTATPTYSPPSSPQLTDLTGNQLATTDVTDTSPSSF